MKTHKYSYSKTQLTYAADFLKEHNKSVLMKDVDIKEKIKRAMKQTLGRNKRFYDEGNEEEIIKYYATAGFFLMFNLYEEGTDSVYWEVEILVDPAVSVLNQEYKDKKIK